VGVGRGGPHGSATVRALVGGGRAENARVAGWGLRPLGR
jgi:hypothetical protein